MYDLADNAPLKKDIFLVNFYSSLKSDPKMNERDRKIQIRIYLL